MKTEEKPQLEINIPSSSELSVTLNQKEDLVVINNLETTTTKERKGLSIVDNPIFCGCLLVLAGIAIAFQAGCNATLNRYGGRSFSSVITFSIAVLCCIVFFFFDVTVGKRPLPTSHVKAAPWYAWIGGILGAYYVITNILTVPRLGAATVLSIFVCAQIIMACIIDHFGFVGVTKRRYTIWRILASLGLVGCVVVIAMF
ncbi:hypothetical protein BD770DRAFT_400318 [Pilaira anomala]|nr:hypothetical protein BD770DRAFT_400318 [Pilaira anomala]